MWQWCGEGGAGGTVHTWCVLCVQVIGKDQRQLQDPSTYEGWRSDLEKWVKSNKSSIQQYNAAISSIDGELAELVGERAAILNQGEPPGRHADDCREWLPWQHVTTVTKEFLYCILVAMAVLLP